MDHTDRVVVLVDMDCFYCQVEEKLNPLLEGKPIAVVQYNAWRGGGIIAVNYPARDRGVTRHMRGEDALKSCPDINLVSVPEVRGKADLTKYREAGKRVAEVLENFTHLLERASVDEAYLDITEEVNKRIQEDLGHISIEKMINTHVVGHKTEDFLINSYSDRVFCERNYKLAVGGLIAEEIRAAVFAKTGYRCSAGIAHNKILAKLVCGLHKPNKQTILPQDAISELYQNMPVRKITGLGGKLGNAVSEVLKIENMGELIGFSERELAKRFDEKTANWLYNLARGIDLEPVSRRLVSKSIGCCKQFRGKSCLILPEDVEHWMRELATEIVERLEKDVEENNRRAKQVVVSFTQKVNRKNVTSSRTQNLNSYEVQRVKQIGMEVINKHCLKQDGKYQILFLGLSVGNFEDVKNVREITSFFKNASNVDKNVKAVVSEDNNKAKDIPADNSSIYSDSTVDLEEDLDSLIYYDDVMPKKDLQNKSSDSISNEIASTSMADTDGKGSANSFFKRYFHDLDVRNFDTSKIFEKDAVSSDEDESAVEEHSSEICPECNKEIPIDELQSHVDYHLAINISTQNTSDEEICPECTKTIPKSELVSHMDYHFALKLVKEESHLYKQPPSNGKTPKPAQKKNLKRKIPEVGSLKHFLKAEPLNDGNSKFCPDCCKRIKLEDLPNHADFHEAKKLHTELNSSDALKKESSNKRAAKPLFFKV